MINFSTIIIKFPLEGCKQHEAANTQQTLLVEWSAVATQSGTKKESTRMKYEADEWRRRVAAAGIACIVLLFVTGHVTLGVCQISVMSRARGLKEAP